MLRISDRLIENLIMEVMERDEESDFVKKRGEQRGVYLDTLVSVINSLGISLSIWEISNADGKGSSTYDWTSLIGAEEKKLIRLLPAQLILKDIPYPETKDKVVELWNQFGSLYELINKTDDSPDLFLDAFHSAKQFVNLF